MGDLSVLAPPAFAGGLRAGTNTGLDQLEQATADALNTLKPGQANAASVHAEMQRLVLTNAVLLQMAPKVSPSAVDEVVRRLRPSRVIDKALEATAEAHAEALVQFGIPAQLLQLLQSWMDVTIEARIVQRQIQVKRAIDRLQRELPDENTAPAPADPSELLSAIALGKALGGLGDATVRLREQAGELFSILPAGRKRGREYPAFQAWPGIAGQPLARTLAALGQSGGAAAYDFFTSPNDLLDGLTPVEALLGRLTLRQNVDLHADGQGLLAEPAEERQYAVVRAAEAQVVTAGRARAGSRSALQGPSGR